MYVKVNFIVVVVRISFVVSIEPVGRVRRADVSVVQMGTVERRRQISLNNFH